jgi:hypothetical protein
MMIDVFRKVDLWHHLSVSSFMNIVMCAVLVSTVSGQTVQPAEMIESVSNVVISGLHDDADQIVALLNSAYADTVPYVLELSEFSGITLSNIEKVPPQDRFEELTHSAIPHPFYRLFRRKHQCDGKDSLLVEREVLSLGNAGYGLRPYVLWTAEYQADFQAGVKDEVVLSDFVYRDRDDVMRLIDNERVTLEQMRAFDSFLHLARWAGRWLLLASDVECQALAGDNVRLTSAQMHLTVECSRKTGELLRVQFRNSDTRTSVWWWEGILDGVRFPARHPKLMFSQTILRKNDNDTEVLHGNALRFESIRTATGKDTATDGAFVWSSYRPFAVVLKDRQVIDRDGVVNVRRTKERNEMVAPTARNLGTRANPVGSGK